MKLRILVTFFLAFESVVFRSDLSHQANGKVMEFDNDRVPAKPASEYQVTYD